MVRATILFILMSICIFAVIYTISGQPKTKEVKYNEIHKLLKRVEIRTQGIRAYSQALNGDIEPLQRIIRADISTTEDLITKHSGESLRVLLELKRLLKEMLIKWGG